MDENGQHVDENVRALVDVLNDMPGISTFSSCGGHDSPEVGQVPAGEFSIAMEVDDFEAFHSLGIIAFAAQQLTAQDDENVFVELTVWSGTDDPDEAGDAVAFDLSGGGIHPDALAQAIRRLM